MLLVINYTKKLVTALFHQNQNDLSGCERNRNKSRCNFKIQVLHSSMPLKQQEMEILLPLPRFFFFSIIKKKKMFMIFMAVLKSYILTYVGGIEVLNFFFKIDIRKYSSHRNFLPFTKVFLWKIVKCIQNLNFQVQFNRLFFL